MFSFNTQDLITILPELCLIVTSFLVLIFDVYKVPKNLIAAFSILGLATSAFYCFQMLGGTYVALWGMFVVNDWATLFKLVFLFSSFLTILISGKYNTSKGIDLGEYYFVLLIATVGMMFMVSSEHLLMIIVGLEILSISSYILCAFNRYDPKSTESALKYFLLGAFATGFLLYGISMVYGATGSMHLSQIALNVQADKFDSNILIVGLLLVICGFGFKIAAAPFHMWTPDVYQGAPTPITAFMTAGPKAAAFAALIKILTTAFYFYVVQWEAVLQVIAILTMTVGNLMALRQENVKRMLAYSSVSHAGYMLIAVVAWQSGGLSSILFYMLSYSLASIGSFGVILAFTGDKDSYSFDDFTGVGFRYPFLSILMLIFMLSLAGIPLTAGFSGKFQIFQAALESGRVWLVIIAFINSVISIFYYLKIVVYMFMKNTSSEQKLITPTGSSLALNIGVIISLAGVLVLGITPDWFIKKTKDLNKTYLVQNISHVNQ